MNRNQGIFQIPVLLSELGKAPSEFLIFSAGTNVTTKGVFLFTEKSQVACMEYFAKRGVQVCVDYEHGMLTGVSLDPAEQKKAAAWCTLECRNGELWAVNVQWTPTAKRMVEAKEYRYISPAFNYGEDGEITNLINCALTNLPATHDALPLVASQTAVAATPTGSVSVENPTEPTESKMKNLVALLSLSEKATEADVVAEVSELKANATALLSATNKSTISEALGTIAAWKAGNEQAEMLSARIATLEAEKQRAEVKAVVEAGVKEGRIQPSLTAWASQLGEKDLPQLKAFIAASATILPKAVKEVATSTSTVTLSAEALAVAKLFGRKPEAYAAFVEKAGPVQVGEMKTEEKSA